MKVYPHYLEEKVFFADPNLRDTNFKSKSACGLPDAIKKTTDLQHMLRSYVSVMKTAQSFRQHKWYESPREDDDDDIDDLFLPVDKPDAVRDWIHSWQRSKATPVGCAFGLREMQMDADELMDEPVMQPVLAFARFAQRRE